jgi:hypothetical protein
VAFNVQVQVGTTTFMRAGQKPFSINTNVVFAYFSTFNTADGYVDGFGCWLIPASDWVLNSDLSATLTFDSSDPRVTECPGSPVGDDGVIAQGLVQNLAGPIVINATWAPTGPVVFTRMTQQRMCQPVAISVGQGSREDVDAVASGPISGAFVEPQRTFAANPQGFFGGVSVFEGQNQLRGFGDFCPGP